MRGILKHACKAVLVFLGLSLSSVRASDGEGPQPPALLSLNVSRISWVDLDMGAYLSQLFSKNSQAPGLELTLDPGLISTSAQLGLGVYQFKDNYAGFEGGFSGVLLAGRTYLFDSMFRKNQTFYGVQGKLQLFFVIIRLGVLYGERDDLGVNVGLGIGR